MRPKRIFLVRHGESEGNANWELYKTIPDWQLLLTKQGSHQAYVAAENLSKEVSREALIRIYSSPWKRARQTAEAFKGFFPNHVYREDPRLREQEWGNYQEAHLAEKIERERDQFGTFFYRMPYGESGADVYDRISSFLDTLHRDFEKPNFPENALIVSHGLTMRLFLMRWFHWSVEQYEALKNPDNCEILEMRQLSNSAKYVLMSKMKRKDGTDYVDPRAGQAELKEMLDLI